MKLTSILTANQKTMVKKIVLPLYRIATGKKKINTKYEVIEFSSPKCHTYFGYYDVSPFQDDKIIYIERKRNSNTCRVVLNDIHNMSKRYVADSRALNWQQGIRLRWFPQSNDIISFNDYIDGKYINRIINLQTGEEKQLDWPLYDINSTGNFGISLDFERLGVMRPGYGYTCGLYSVDNLYDDGIYIIDIEKNQLVKKITYDDLSDNISKIDNVANFYINHLSFSPDGTKFLFFWINECNGFHQASLGVYDMISENLIPLETEYKASHYVWDGNDELVCTILDENYNCKYFRFNIKDGSKKHICPNSLKGDGHPSIYDSRILLTDTYPDNRGFQHIYLVNEENDSKTELLNIYSIPTMNVEMRTDLHPRLSDDKKYISVDSNHAGYRKILLFNLEK